METTDDELRSVDELFQLLANETRMEIMRALWERFSFSAYVTESRDGTPFAELLAASGADDSGNFNYHLGQLTGILVDHREDGYVLTPLGYNLMRSIERYSSFAYETLPEQPIGDPCPFCDGELVGAYRREIVSVRCRDCGGLGADGNFTFVELPATGATERSMPELVDAATLELLSKVTTASHSICWNCWAPMDCSIEVCADHERPADECCEQCDQRFQSAVRAECTSCGTMGQGPLLEYVLTAPDVAVLFRSVGSGPQQIGPWRYRLAAFSAVTETVRSTDPVLVEFEFDLEGRTERITIDEEFTRVDDHRSDGTSRR